MPKERKETTATTQKIILPSSEDTKTDQELIDNFLSHSDEEYSQMGKEIKFIELKKELESGKITKKLEKPEAMLLIENGYFDMLYDNIEHFEGIDKEVLMLMIENGYSNKLYNKLEYFQGIDKEVVMKYIQEVERKDLEKNKYRNLEKFKGILDKEIAMFMVENGYLKDLYENIEYFEGIDKEVVMLMIENGYSDKLYTNIDHFKGIDKEVVMKYIQEVERKNLKDGKYRKLEKFKGILDKEIAIFMIKNGYFDTLYNNIVHFKGIDKEVLILMIENGYSDKLYGKLEYFKGIDKEVVMKYIKEVERKELKDGKYRNLEKFKGMLDKEIAMFMIKNGYLNTLYENIEDFEGIDKEVVMLMIENGYSDKLYTNIDHFKGIDKEVVMKYIQEVERKDIEDGRYRKLEKFKGILNKEIAMFTIENGYLKTLYKNIEHFEGIDKEVVMKYIKKLVEKAGKDRKLNSNYRNLEKFKRLFDKEIAIFIIENGYPGIFYDNIEHFKGIDKEVVMKYIEKLVEKTDKDGKLNANYGNLEKFKGMLDKEIVMFMIENGYHSILIKNLQYFGNDLDNKIASELIDKGYKSQVKKYKEKFKDLSTFTKIRLWGKTE